MNAYLVVAVALIAAGILALAYGQFSYTTETHEAELGPLTFSVEERETVNIPTWAGAAVVIAGVALLAYALRTAPPRG